VVGIEDTDHQSLRVKVAKSIENGIENFARFLWIERRTAEGRREGLVGRLEDSIEDDLALMVGSPERKQID
jgi:hypothetical protein